MLFNFHKGLGSAKFPESPYSFYGKVMFCSPLAGYKECSWLLAWSLSPSLFTGQSYEMCVWLVGWVFFFFFSKNILWVCTDASNLNSGYTVFTMSVSTFGSPFSHVKTSDLSGPNMIIDLLYLIITHKNIRITILIAI